MKYQNIQSENVKGAIIFMVWPDCQRGPIINRSTCLQSGRPVYKRVDQIINFLNFFQIRL